MLLADGKMVLQRIIDRMTEIGRCCGMEINVEKQRCWKSEVNHPNIDYDRSKQPDNVEYFSSLDSMITSRARRVGVIKRTFNKKNVLSAKKIELNLKRKTKVLHLERSVVGCWNLDTSDIRSDKPGNIRWALYKFLFIYIFWDSIYEINTRKIYRVIQEESALLWEMIVWVILSKKVHTNMGPILNGYGVMGIF